jgi:hypothetical protein
MVFNFVFVLHPPGCRYAPTTGLKLANAFGVILDPAPRTLYALHGVQGATRPRAGLSPPE